MSLFSIEELTAHLKNSLGVPVKVDHAITFMQCDYTVIPFRILSVKPVYLETLENMMCYEALVHGLFFKCFRHYTQPLVNNGEGECIVTYLEVLKQQNRKIEVSFYAMGARWTAYTTVLPK